MFCEVHDEVSADTVARRLVSCGPFPVTTRMVFNKDIFPLVIPSVVSTGYLWPPGVNLSNVHFQQFVLIQVHWMAKQDSVVTCKKSFQYGSIH